MKVLILSLIVVLIDQISKFVVRFSFEYGRPYRVLGDWLRLTYIENPGMAFGIRVGGQLFFTLFAFLATIVIFIYIIRSRDQRVELRVSLALILGGAIGNLIDRVLYGKVVDFVEVIFAGTRWPIFNLADAAVTLGMIMLLSLLLFSRNSKRNQGTEEAAV